jgi:hypothetical protein
LSLLQLPIGLRRRLQITPEHKTKLEGLQAKLQDETRATFAETAQGGDRRAAFQKMQAARAQKETEAAALLSPAQ